LAASAVSTQTSFQITDGYALSNAGPLLGTKPPLPLNAFVGLTVDQAFTLDIERTSVVDELRAMFDVVLYVEYTANL
jgi:hypothetical protein